MRRRPLVWLVVIVILLGAAWGLRIYLIKTDKSWQRQPLPATGEAPQNPFAPGFIPPEAANDTSAPPDAAAKPEASSSTANEPAAAASATGEPDGQQSPQGRDSSPSSAEPKPSSAGSTTEPPAGG